MAVLLNAGCLTRTAPASHENETTVISGMAQEEWDWFLFSNKDRIKQLSEFCQQFLEGVEGWQTLVKNRQEANKLLDILQDVKLQELLRAIWRVSYNDGYSYDGEYNQYYPVILKQWQTPLHRKLFGQVTSDGYCSGALDV